MRIRLRTRKPTTFTRGSRLVTLPAWWRESLGKDAPFFPRSFISSFTWSPVQRPDSIDPHLVAFAFRSALWNTSLSRRKRNSVVTRGKREQGKPETSWIQRISWRGCPEGVRGVCDDSRVCENNTRENPHSFKSLSNGSSETDQRRESAEKQQIQNKLQMRNSAPNIS